ncbi:metallophosphoesterase [Paenibacillus solisilvae]|uniref:Metallophosphoesterase n=1 Tax=Paenibacillus solisilvae TaxID=2486751 RepID=A0ABW0VTG9_9BACL
MRVVRTISLIAAFFLIFFGLQFLIGWNAREFLSAVLPPIPAVIYWICFWFIALSYIISRLLEKWIPGPIARGLKWIGSYWFAILLYSVILLPLADLAAWGLRDALAWSMDESFIGAGAAAILVYAAILIKGSWNAWTPVVRPYTLDVAKHAGHLEQLRIAVASDIHLGTLVGRRHLKLLVGQINALKPDIVLLPGDVIDDSVEPFKRNHYGSILAGLKSTYGTYAVLGNHEYIGGKIEEFVELMAEAGIPVLMDHSVKVAESFYIIGRKDKSANRFRGAKGRGRVSVQELVAELDQSLPLILMDHQPSALNEAAEGGIDISLSGHTHRGQMAPNHFITRRLFELDWGYIRKGLMHAIVSSGYGTWGPPVRIGSRSEIVDITVQFNKIQVKAYVH